jgi:putative ABC transport system permease protein
VRAGDLLRLTGGAVSGHRLRSALTMLGILIGIASVILLTSIGEGTRQYVMSEFTQFGTNLLAVTPGKTETTGMPGVIATTVHKLTPEDADALRQLPGVLKVVPLSLGMAEVEHGGRGRSVFIYGVNADVPDVWKFRVRQGRFLPGEAARRSAPLTALGPKLKREIFGDANALGEYVRIGGHRFQVIGVMEPKGRFLSFDLDDTAYIPVLRAQQLFNRDELVEIDVLFSEHADVDGLVAGIRRVLIARHDGEEDFTVTTQTEMLDVLDRVLGIVSLAVGGIGAISLLVGAVGILTMMWISVNERTAEIGLIKALGAGRGQILLLFLGEASLLSVAGGVLGVAAGLGVAAMLSWALPGLPVHTPVRFVFAALGVSLAVGLLSGVLPARRAAGLDPVEALHAE